MTNLEFILSSCNINSEKIDEREKKFIKEVLIPHYEFYNQPWFPATSITLHCLTKEVRTINNAEMLAALKSLI